MDNDQRYLYHAQPIARPSSRQLPPAPQDYSTLDPSTGGPSHQFGIPFINSTDSYLAGPSSHSYGTQPSLVQAIPAPSPKTSYEAPVFRTFQDRKRAKELAWAESKMPTSSGSFEVSPGPVINKTVTNGPNMSHVRQPVIPPDALALMAQPGEHGRPPPRPPSRSPSVVSLASAIPSISHPTSFVPTPLEASPTYHCTVSRSSSQSPLERSDTMASVKSLDRAGFPTGRRPLPQTPVGVSSTKSLDRGAPVRAKSTDLRTRRKHPSVVNEEDEAASTAPQSPIIKTPSMSTPSAPPTIDIHDDGPSRVWGTSNPPVSASEHAVASAVPTFMIELEDDVKQPARFRPLPTFNLPDENLVADNEIKVPQIAVSGPPTISVTTSDHHPAPHLPISGAVVCGGCGQAIIGRIVNAMGRRFHPQCFSCNECESLLEHVSSFEWEGKAYCHLDYHDKFAPRCHHCKTPIIDSQFVTLNDDIAGERHYHELHFFCSECGDPFLDPSKSSAPGTERSRGDGESQTNPFTFHQGHPYCENCHTRLYKPKCKGCRRPIPGEAIKALNANWHKECFKCADCNTTIVNNIFFPKDNQALCTGCYEVSVS